MTGAPLVAGRLTTPIVAPLQARSSARQTSSTLVDSLQHHARQAPKARLGARTTRARGRLLGAASIVTCVAALSMTLTGVTFGKFSASTPGGTHTFSAGTVSMTGGTTTGVCSSTTLVPNGAATTCALQVTYAGNASAWMGLDIFIATKHGGATGAENLYNPSGGDDPAAFSVTDNQSPSVTYTLPTTALGSCPTTGQYSSYGSYNACYQNTDLLVNKVAFTGSSTVTFSISITIPTDNNTKYQGGTAAVVVQAHAVQSKNNGSTASCTAGAPCPGITGWS